MAGPGGSLIESKDMTGESARERLQRRIEEINQHTNASEGQSSETQSA